ncbi:MAG: ornithine carbamoyltransferase [Actinomycetota bacterium]
MGATMGAHVVVATPGGKWAPKASVVNQALEIAKRSGAQIEVTFDAKAAATGASAIYTDVWMSMGDSESDRAEKIAALTPFAVTADLMKLTARDSIFMHCLPAHRGEEVSAEVIDGEKSVVWRQAFHRRTTIQALLYHLTKGDLMGNK